MNLEQLMTDHNEKAKRFVNLQLSGISVMEATYKVYGVEVGDTMLKMKQSEIILKPNNQ